MQFLKSKFLMVYLLTFVNGLSFTMMIPIFPFLLKTYGQPEIMLWFLVASYSFFQFFWAPIIGSLSDKYWRKPVMLLTQWGTFFSWIILWIAYFLPETHIFGIIFLPILAIFLSRIVDGITWWNMSVISAMISDMTTKAERTVIFGKNSAVMGVTLIIWPSLWAFSMGTEYWFLWTAIVGWIVSAITLGIMFFKVTESLKEENKQKELQISFKDMNIIRKISKYWHITTIKFSVVMKLLMFLAFTMYTTISVLYLIDKFGFSPLTVWYYLMITGSFLIFHQSFSIQPIVKRVGDLHWLIVGQWAMFLWYLGMWLSPNIILYTIAYFVAVLWISLSMTTLQALFSKSADERSQWEVMWISSSLDSLMSMVAPVLWSFLYAITDISIFIIISVVPLISILVYVWFFRKMLARNKKFCE